MFVTLLLFGFGQIVDQVNGQITSNYPQSLRCCCETVAACLVPVVNLSLIGANGEKIPCGSLPCLSFGWCELLRFCCLCTLR